jgi:hypothetical protein
MEITKLHGDSQEFSITSVFPCVLLCLYDKNQQRKHGGRGDSRRRKKN